MKKFSSLTIIIIISILYSCGGTKTDELSKENDKQEQKQEKKQENDKASEKLSKSTKEGMMMLLEECNINLHEALEYSEVKRNSESYVIKFEANDVDEELKEELDAWFFEQVEFFENDGWSKFVNMENETMFGVIINEILFLVPPAKAVDVTYGITLSSSYDTDSNKYSFTFSAN
jgi:hypothetical protein